MMVYAEDPRIFSVGSGNCLYPIPGLHDPVLISYMDVHVYLDSFFYVYSPVVYLALFNVLIVYTMKYRASHLPVADEQNRSEQPNPELESRQARGKSKAAQVAKQLTVMCLMVSSTFIVLNVPNIIF